MEMVSGHSGEKKGRIDFIQPQRSIVFRSMNSGWKVQIWSSTVLCAERGCLVGLILPCQVI